MSEHARLVTAGYRAVVACVSCGRVGYLKGMEAGRYWFPPNAAARLNLPGILCSACQSRIEARCPECGRRKIDGYWEDRPVRFAGGSRATLPQERCLECSKEIP